MTAPRILPSVTTLSLTPSTWETKLCEAVTYKIPQLGLFLTGLPDEKRNVLFGFLCSLRRSYEFTIPFVHAVASMEEWEYRFLIDQFGTEAFNLHPRREYPLRHHLSREVRSRIFIENSAFRRALAPEDIDGFAGLCLDLSHLEDTRRADPRMFDAVLRLTEQFPVGANHISAVRTKIDPAPITKPVSSHVFDAEHGLSYLEGLPLEAVSGLCALELENTLEEQVRLVSVAAKHLAAGGRSLAHPERQAA